ncbi:MAG: hypothetical protein ACRENK_00100, partial [Gemmatimonadaceae bacterium]
MRCPRFFLIIALAASAVESPALYAQTASNSTPSLFTRNDAILAAAFAGATVAMFPIDKALARMITNDVSKTNKYITRGTTGVELITDPGSLVIGAALYTYGRVAHKGNIEALGWHGTE